MTSQMASGSDFSLKNNTNIITNTNNKLVIVNEPDSHRIEQLNNNGLIPYCG